MKSLSSMASKVVFTLASVALVQLAAAAPKSQGELAVAIRYLKAEGTSHAHIYLYREDGKLLRQLTRDDKGQDRSPVFAPDGKTIVFKRELSEALAEYWSVEPLGSGLRKLDAPPEWYSKSNESKFFTNRDPKDWPENKPLPGSPAMEGEAPRRYAAPDGSVELVLGDAKGDEDYGRCCLHRTIPSSCSISTDRSGSRFSGCI
jgi:hypothetical protein